MRIKGVNPIERHLEKIVLLAVGVIFLGVVAMQFLVSPNQIDVGNNITADPGDEIYARLKTKADALKGQIEDPNPSMPDVQQADLLDAYEQGTEMPTSVTPTIAAWLDRPSGIEDLIGGSVEQLLATGAIQPLEVPAPVSTIAAAQWNTLDPFAENDWPGLGGVRSGNTPADFVGVTIEASFPGTQLLDALTAVEDGKRPIPRKLWQRGGLAILDVQVERQKLNADGTWSDAAPITPAGPEALAELSPDPDPEAVMTLVRAVVDEPGAIMTPNYPPTISGDAWVPPTQAKVREARWANQSEADRIRATIARLESEIGSGGRSRATRTTTSSRDPGGSGRTPSNTNTGTPSNRTSDRQDESKRRQIERLEERLAELGFGEEDDSTSTRRTGTPASTGRTPYVDPRMSDDPRTTRQPARAGRRDTPSLLDAEALPIWAHDLSVRPGETYRYRLRTVVNNPLYGREALLDPEDPGQLELAKTPTVAGAWSDWTEPTKIPARKYLFVRGVSGSGALDGATRVTGEVFEMYYGYYRRSPFTLELGDTVSSSTSLPDTLLMFNPGQISQADADRALADLERWSTERERNPDQPPVRPEPPAGASRGPGTIELRFDAALVDVAESMTRERASALDASDRALLEAIFRLPDGSLMVRELGEDEGPAYALVSASATRGERNTIARVVPEDQGLTGFVTMTTGLSGTSDSSNEGP